MKENVIYIDLLYEICNLGEYGSINDMFYFTCLV